MQLGIAGKGGSVIVAAILPSIGVHHGGWLVVVIDGESEPNPGLSVEPLSLAFNLESPALIVSGSAGTRRLVSLENLLNQTGWKVPSQEE